MAQAHINFDLKMAIRLEGVGTDADWDEIGKVVAAAQAKFSLNQKVVDEIGAKVLGGAINIKSLRNDMRNEVIEQFRANWNFNAKVNPYQGQRNGIRDWWDAIAKGGLP
jgi:hypothetical protein